MMKKKKEEENQIDENYSNYSERIVSEKMQSSTPTPHVRKISTSLIIFAACVLGIGIALFTLNFWHTSRCATEKSAGEIEEMVEALNRRILQTESQVTSHYTNMSYVLS